MCHLDYGDEEMINTSSENIKQLSKEFLQLPFQGISVSLHGNDNTCTCTCNTPYMALVKHTRSR